MNILQADAIGCHIITVTNELLKKVELFGKDLDEYSLETVRMFSTDARSAGLKLNSGNAIRLPGAQVLGHKGERSRMTQLTIG